MYILLDDENLSARCLNLFKFHGFHFGEKPSGRQIVVQNRSYIKKKIVICILSFLFLLPTSSINYPMLLQDEKMGKFMRFSLMLYQASNI